MDHLSSFLFGNYKSSTACLRCLGRIPLEIQIFVNQFLRQCAESCTDSCHSAAGFVITSQKLNSAALFRIYWSGIRWSFLHFRGSKHPTCLKRHSMPPLRTSERMIKRSIHELRNSNFIKTWKEAWNASLGHKEKNSWCYSWKESGWVLPISSEYRRNHCFHHRDFWTTVECYRIRLIWECLSNYHKDAFGKQ